jgi:hypothetical protein
MTKPRRKKKYLLLKGWRGHFIVGSRKWYDEKQVRRDRHWKIVAQSDDESMLTTMAMLTDKHLGMSVINTIEEN